MSSSILVAISWRTSHEANELMHCVVRLAFPWSP